VALAALGEVQPHLVIDLNGRLGEEVEHLPGYQGVCW
jgi:GDP-mannose 6-dehydrogenase